MVGYVLSHSLKRYLKETAELLDSRNFRFETFKNFGRTFQINLGWHKDLSAANLRSLRVAHGWRGSSQLTPLWRELLARVCERSLPTRQMSQQPSRKRFLRSLLSYHSLKFVTKRSSIWVALHIALLRMRWRLSLEHAKFQFASR